MYCFAQQIGGNEQVLYALIAFGVVVLMLPTALCVWMIVDCIKHEPAGSSKTKWMVVLIVFGIFGAMAYNFSRRKPRIRQYGR